MTAEICGSRFGRGLLTPGGTRFDLNRKLSDTLLRRLDTCAAQVDASVQLLWDSPSVMARFSGAGAVSMEEAAALGLVGPPARACGLPRDVRHTHPLSDLPAPPEMFTFPYGDVHARARIRHAEIQASAAYCRRVLEVFPHEENAHSTLAAPPGRLAPGHLAIALVEARHGEVCHLALTDDAGCFAMYKVIDPSMHNWEGLALALRGRQISDFPLCNKSFNLSYCGHDL
jgi:Ni,Fe-hydrogenase III large subunit